jgi:hypothetical protein
MPDEEAEGESRLKEECPVVDTFPNAGMGLRASKTSFEKIRGRREKQNKAPWYPFKSLSEWELARWLVESGVTGKKIESFLKLEKVCQSLDSISLWNTYPYTQIRGKAELQFQNRREFLVFIDSLPPGPKFMCTPRKIMGDIVNLKGEAEVQYVELWRRDPIKCIRELIGNPNFNGRIDYAPTHRYRNQNHSNREYSEMSTATWWWKIQVGMI